MFDAKRIATRITLLKAELLVLEVRLGLAKKKNKQKIKDAILARELTIRGLESVYEGLTKGDDK